MANPKKVSFLTLATFETLPEHGEQQWERQELNFLPPLAPMSRLIFGRRV